jgi:hypothetical protein
MGGEIMSIARLAALAAAALIGSASSGHAGPCASQIVRMQARIDARLEANAAAGPTARESNAALLHRQPTPGSIAAAEARLNEESATSVEALTRAMAQARAADGAGDKQGCEKALAEAERAIGP